MLQYLQAFLAGFVSTFVFHQPVVGLFYLAGKFKARPWSLKRVPPLGVPAVISSAFWAGLWGIVLWMLIRDAAGAAYWLRAIVLGAVLPASVALFVVMPLKGKRMAAGWNPAVIAGSLLVNACWGFGTALLIWLLQRLVAMG